MEQPTAPLNIAPFDFQGQEIRVVDQGDELWFLASDVCSAVKVKNINQALTRLDPDEKGVILNDTPGGIQKVGIISESGMYRLALSSRKSEAKPFQKWASQLIKRFRHGDLSLAEEVIERNGGRDQAGLERVAVQAGMFMQHEAMQRTMRRFEGIEARKAFTSMLGRHSVTPIGYGHCTNRIYQGTLGGKAKDVSKRLGLTKKQNLRDHLPTVDLIGVTLAEALATERIEKEDAQGDRQCGTVCEIASHEVGQAIRRTRA